MVNSNSKDYPIKWVAVAVCGTIILVCTFFAVWLQYIDRNTDTMIEAKDARIGAIEERLKFKNDQLKERERQIGGKDKLLQEYRKRLGIEPGDGAEYSQMSNQELKKKALAFAGELRGFASQ